jgi:hypothetical protein
MLIQDPVTQTFVESGAFAASPWNDDGSASWRISDDLEQITNIGSLSDVAGQFTGSTFTGSYTFPFISGETPVTAAISLARDTQ